MLRLNLDKLSEEVGLPPLTLAAVILRYASIVYKREPQIKYSQGKIYIESVILYSRRNDLSKIYNVLINKRELLDKILEELIVKFNIDVYLLKETFNSYIKHYREAYGMQREREGRER